MYTLIGGLLLWNNALITRLHLFYLPVTLIVQREVDCVVQVINEKAIYLSVENTVLKHVLVNIFPALVIKDTAYSLSQFGIESRIVNIVWTAAKFRGAKMLIIIFTIIFALTTFHLLKKHFRQLQLSGKFPGPPSLPFLGSGLDLINKSPTGNLIN